MKPRILLTGANGQVGRELCRLLPFVGELSAFDRQRLDLCKPQEIRQAIGLVRPNVIVNAAAYTAVDQAESDEAQARKVNADAPALLAEEAKKIEAVIVHYSTDYVFDGRKKAPYVEDDQPNPQSVYGRTKLEGERAVQQSGADHLIVRTSWVYASEGRNFVLTMLKLGAQREELKIVCDQIGAPTWAAEIAAGTARILGAARKDQKGRPCLGDVSGIYHMTAHGQTSWHEFAKAVFEEATVAGDKPHWIAVAANHRPLTVQRILPISTSEYPTPASRPAYSVLSNARLARTFGVGLPTWREQLHSFFTGALPAFP